MIFQLFPIQTTVSFSAVQAAGLLLRRSNGVTGVTDASGSCARCERGWKLCRWGGDMVRVQTRWEGAKELFQIHAYLFVLLVNNFFRHAPPASLLHMYVYMCIYIYINMYVMYVYMYIYTYTLGYIIELVRIGGGKSIQLEDFPAGHIRLAEGFPPPADGGVYVVWGMVAMKITMSNRQINQTWPYGYGSKLPQSNWIVHTSY